MVTLRSIVTAFAGAALFVQPSIAHSVKRNPVSYVSLLDDAVIKAPSHRVNSLSKFDLTFTLDGGQTPVRLVLEPNHNILHDEFAVTYIGAGGEAKESDRIPRTSHRVFKGRAFVKKPGREGWVQAGWARVTVHKDGKKPIFEGAFRIFGDAHHIQTGAHYRKLKHEDDPSVDESVGGEDVMVVYRDSDIIPASSFGSELKRRSLADTTCESDGLDFNSRYDMEVRSLEARTLGSSRLASLFGRQSGDVLGGGGGANYIPNIGSTDGCPSTRKVALVGIATDCNYWEEFEGDREELRKNVIDLVNKASALYEDTFSISLGIRNLTVVDQACSRAESETAPWNLRCSDRISLNDRLNLFSAWRGENPDTNAYWSLLTTCNTQSAVGLAWRGQLCREGASEARDNSGSNETVAATNVVVRTPAEWQIFAHETGHTFGAVHDCTEGECPVSTDAQSCCPLSARSCNADGKFIMNPSTGQGITEFSPCSIGNICSGLLRNVDGECLTNNRNVGTITGSQCGNGIVEEGEDCDCGGAEGCDENSCCNAETCEFREGAQCDPTNEDCCTDQCRFASSGTVCRESSSDCDPEETCPGDSGNCPEDVHLDDGDSCGDGLRCASGQCTSRDQQCRAMLGSGGGNNDDIEACGGNTCMLSCQAPNIEGGQCSLYNSNFLDGTPCGGRGRCDNGSCEGSSTWGEIQDWFRNNRHIAIPVGASVGGVLFLLISWCIFSSCRRRIRARKRAKKPPVVTSIDSSPTFPGANGGVDDGQWRPGNQQQRSYGEQPYDSQPYDSQPYDVPPPPTDYNYNQNPIPNPYEQQGRWSRTGSTRYA